MLQEMLHFSHLYFIIIYLALLTFGVQKMPWYQVESLVQLQVQNQLLQ